MPMTPPPVPMAGQREFLGQPGGVPGQGQELVASYPAWQQGLGQVPPPQMVPRHQQSLPMPHQKQFPIQSSGVFNPGQRPQAQTPPQQHRSQQSPLRSLRRFRHPQPRHPVWLPQPPAPQAFHHPPTPQEPQPPPAFLPPNHRGEHPAPPARLSSPPFDNHPPSSRNHPIQPPPLPPIPGGPPCLSHHLLPRSHSKDPQRRLHHRARHRVHHRLKQHPHTPHVRRVPTFALALVKLLRRGVSLAVSLEVLLDGGVVCFAGCI